MKLKAWRSMNCEISINFTRFALSASDSLATNGAIQICIVLYCIVRLTVMATKYMPKG